MNTTLELLTFIFQDASHFFGSILLIFVLGGVLANIFKSCRLFEVNNTYKAIEPPAQDSSNKNVFNDLLTVWNRRNPDKK